MSFFVQLSITFACNWLKRKSFPGQPGFRPAITRTCPDFNPKTLNIRNITHRSNPILVLTLDFYVQYIETTSETIAKFGRSVYTIHGKMYKGLVNRDTLAKTYGKCHAVEFEILAKVENSPCACMRCKLL